MNRCSYLFPLLLAVACSTAGEGEDNNSSCGDSIVAGAEQCDDGNTVSGDGCSATCRSESTGGGCGNNVVGTGEECDDGNTTDGDGCSATCTNENSAGGGTCNAPFNLMLTNNMGALEGAGMGDTSASTNQVTQAGCDEGPAGAGKDHVWRLVLPDPRDLYVLVDDTSSFDTVIRILGTPCDVSTEVAEFTGSDGCANGEAASEFLGYVSLPAGTYYIVIDGATANDAGTYKFDVLAVTSTCGDGELDPIEFCDDGDNDPSDGCSAKCEVEDGYTCDFSSPSVCSMDTASSAPAPGDLKLNEFMAADGPNADTNCDTKKTGTDDEFVEIVNVSSKDLNLEGVTVADSVIVRHTFGAMMLPAGEAVVIWGAGMPMCAGVDNFDVASTGQLGLNDGGDTIKIELNGTSLVTHQYGTATVGTSFNLSPDVTGTAYALHSAVTGAVGNFTPGKKANNTAF